MISRQQPAAFSMTVAVDVSARPNNSKIVVVSMKNGHGGVEVEEIQEIGEKSRWKALVANVEHATILA